MRDTWRWYVLASAVCLAMGCSKPGPNAPVPSTASSGAVHESVEDDEDEVKEGDPCSLLEPKEVEAVLGQPLAVPPHVNAPDEASRDTGCHYMGADLREVKVDVTWSGASMVWNMLTKVQGAINQHMKGMLKLADGTELAGEWDEARVQGCCTFMALRGDQMIEVDVAGSKADIPAAAGLADAAFKRIDNPLAIKGSEHTAAAEVFQKAHRPAPRGACELVSRAEAEGLIGPLSADPKADGSVCHYQLPPVNGLNRFVDLKIRWQGGYRELRENASMANDIGSGFGLKALEQLPEDLAKLVGPASWEAMHMSVGSFEAVKKDVMISTDNRTAPTGDAEKMVAKALSKI